ncbi:MAG: hypothetical protein FD145_482 [Candidatus Saganbacteria bacterium]|uniref:Outer membrane protein beta-barrel domain-containing protein n=1 Tax=Candidatus Saganbacteria bacterium TaxID=2575572 RepID=A0A833L1L5_UNCSA|nr:MAG: hypothetical protein FD145_482 [Candidatus Saganbacteria bacterium]
MKRVFALLVVFAFVAALAAPVFAANVAKLKADLKKLEAKLKVTKVKKTKASLQKQIAALKKKIAAGQVIVAPPPPPPAPVAVPPPPAPIKAAPAPAQAGLFGMGLETAAEVGLRAGMIGLNANVLLADPIGIGPMIGLPANAVKYVLGVGYAQGKDTASKDWKAVPLNIGGVIMLPADMMGGIESFVSGGINYVVYRTGAVGGTLGGDICAGVQGDLGLGGKTFGQVGYSILRSGTNATKGTFSSKSLSFMVGQKIIL